MLRKVFLFIALAVTGVFAQTENYNGYDDTAIVELSGTNTVYSKWFPMSKYENAVIILMVNDTTQVGYASDSAKFFFGYQLGSPIWDRRKPTTNTYQTDTVLSSLIILDTFDIHTSANITPRFVINDSIGVLGYQPNKKFIDTTSVYKYASMRTGFSPDWGVWFRVWEKGLTGNINITKLDQVITVIRRVGLPVLSR